MLSEKELETINEVSGITFTDYDITGKFIPVDSLMSAIEDLLVEFHHKEDEVSDLQNDIENNYKLIEEGYYD
jgi:hypothetical protein